MINDKNITDKITEGKLKLSSMYGIDGNRNKKCDEFICSDDAREATIIETHRTLSSFRKGK